MTNPIQKNCFYVIALIFVIIVIITACKNNAPIELGFVGTLSGAGSDLAVSGRRGVELALKEINAKGGWLGQEVVLVEKDDLNEKDRAVEIVTEFETMGIELVIGHYTSGMMLSAIDYVNESPLLYLSPTVSADSLSQKDDHMIRFIASTKEQAEVIGQVANINNAKDFIVIMDGKNIGFNQYLYENFQNEIKKFEGTVTQLMTYEKLEANELDQIIETIRSTQVTNVFVIGNSADFATIAQKAFVEEIKINLYGPLWAHTSDLLQYGGEAVEGAFLVSAIDLESEKEAFRKVNEAYQNAYGETITFSAVYSYEAMMALDRAVKQCESTDYEMVKKTLIEIAEFEGLQNSFHIDAYGDNKRNYGIELIENGTYTRVD